MHNILFSLLFILLLMFVGCKGDDSNCCPNPLPVGCDKNTIIDEEVYQQISTDNYGIDNVVLNGHCLEIKIGASGCDVNNWEMNLIASEIVVETLPTQRNAKIELINDEDCLAYFEKTVSFDLKPLQVSGSNQIQLTIEGWNTPILYQY